MTQLRELYKCDKCGNVVQILHQGAPALVCCGENMEQLEAQTADPAEQKHVPVVEETTDGIEVVVGSTHHPMEEEHYIKFIEVLTTEQVLRAELDRDQDPIAQFNVAKDEVIEVREYCNLHGLWKA
ncbi:desulfoferrodoxin [Natroniella sulfidigena]|uniref:desulfoferrodoxin n=1 Tax=Natroniella sulfidigena TaxID=723921 RepID=UPI00200B9F5F|nr:desulfoferrodoxin [Natroniella sulfidigena]